MSSDPDALKAEALAQYRKGRARRCHALLEEALEAAPERPDLAWRVAHARLEAGDVPGTLAAYARALELDPGWDHLEAEALAPLDDLLTRRPTFKNAVKVRKALRERKMPKLRERIKPSAAPPREE